MPDPVKLYADKIRKTVFETINHAGGGHFGGTLSCVEILCVLYDGFIRYDAGDSQKPDRDRLVLSKGHAGPVLYAILADKGFFPKEWLEDLDKGGSNLPKHVDRLKVPGVDFSTGPLGQGISAAVGMACAAKLDKSGVRVYVILGDGECDEGQVWEAAMCAAHYKVDNLVAIVDRNRRQIDGMTNEIMELEPFAQKWEAFGWRALTTDGHDTIKIKETLREALAARGKPAVIIADTVKGKGISYMENDYTWHSGSLTEEQFARGVSDLEG